MKTKTLQMQDLWKSNCYTDGHIPKCKKCGKKQWRKLNRQIILEMCHKLTIIFALEVLEV